MSFPASGAEGDVAVAVLVDDEDVCASHASPDAQAGPLQ